MEAIDEALDYYAEKAMNEAAAEYEELIVDAEESVKDALAHLMGMIAYFEKLRDKLYLLLEMARRKILCKRFSTKSRISHYQCA